MKKIQLFMSALLLCGLSVFTSCSSDSDSDDNGSKDVRETERIVFEKQFTQDLQAAADGMKFDAAAKASSSIKEFIDALDEQALADKVFTLVTNVLVGGLQSQSMEGLSAQDKAAVTTCLKERLGMTDEDINALETFNIVNAKRSLGTLKLSFKDGKCEVTNDAEAFTIENTNAKSETSTIAVKFSDESDGLCFFINLYGVPLAIQLPKSINITKTGPDGVVFSGDVNLTTVDADQSKYVNFKQHGWKGEGTLSANLNNRKEDIELYVKHTSQGAFDLKVAFDINNNEYLRLEVADMHDAYTDEEIESFEEMREMGDFFNVSYEILKALRGKSVDKITITLNDNMVVEGKVDDVAKSLIALGNVRKLYGTKPGKDAIDKYTQELNKYIHYTVSQKNTGITADGTLLTFLKNQTNGEYQPVVSLKFSGESEALPMIERMSETDLANYKKILGSFTPLVDEIKGIIESGKEKGVKIVQAVKDKFSMK